MKLKNKAYFVIFSTITCTSVFADGTRIVKFYNSTSDIVYQIRGKNYAPGSAEDPDVKLEGHDAEPIIPAYYVDKKGTWHAMPQEGDEKIDTTAYQAWLADHNYYDPINPEANPYGAKDKYNGDVLAWRNLELGGTIYLQDTGEKTGDCWRGTLLQKQYRIKMWNEKGANVCKRMCGSTKEKGVIIDMYPRGQIDYWQDPSQHHPTDDC